MAISAIADIKKIDLEPDNTRTLPSYSYVSEVLTLYSVSVSVRNYKFQYQFLSKALAATVIASTYLAEGTDTDGVIGYGTDGVTATASWRGDGGYNVNIAIFQSTTTRTAVV